MCMYMFVCVFMSSTHAPAQTRENKALTLADSQHQLHGFGPAHPSISVIQTLQEARGGG